MKAVISRLKEILLNDKEDLQYLLFAGVPVGIFEIVLHYFFDYAILY